MHLSLQVYRSEKWPVAALQAVSRTSKTDAPLSSLSDCSTDCYIMLVWLQIMTKNSLLVMQRSRRLCARKTLKYWMELADQYQHSTFVMDSIDCILLHCMVLFFDTHTLTWQKKTRVLTVTNLVCEVVLIILDWNVCSPMFYAVL